MTREEAIKMLKSKMDGHTDTSYEWCECVRMAIKALEQESILDKIRAEIMDCLKALDDIEKSGFNIYLPNEMSGRRLSYQQCIGFVDKYRAESEDRKEQDIGDYPDTVPNQFDNMTGSMNL